MRIIVCLLLIFFTNTALAQQKTAVASHQVKINLLPVAVVANDGFGKTARKENLRHPQTKMLLSEKLYKAEEQYFFMTNEIETESAIKPQEIELTLVLTFSEK